MHVRSILAAIDFSPRSAHAVERAALLAQQHNAQLHLLHVLPPIPWQAFGKVLVEHPLVTEKHLYDKARARLDEAAGDCRARYAIPVQCFVDVGSPHECIAGYVKEKGIDVTVLGPHEGNIGRDLFIGATALRLLHRGTQPALVVETAPAAPYRNILVAIDFSDISRTLVQAAVAIAPGAAIHALHVFDVLFEGKMRYAGVEEDVIAQYRKAEETEAAQTMGSFIAAAGKPVVPVLRQGYPARVILEEAEALQADLVILGKRGRSGIEELMLGSVAESVLHRLDRDLLLLGETR